MRHAPSHPDVRVSWNTDWLMWAVVCPVCGPLPAYEQREDAEEEAREHQCEESGAMAESRRHAPSHPVPPELSEWVKHPEKFTYYLVGNPGTRFAITKSSGWRFPWQRPRGGWLLGRITVWWSR